MVPGVCGGTCGIADAVQQASVTATARRRLRKEAFILISQTESTGLRHAKLLGTDVICIPICEDEVNSFA